MRNVISDRDGRFQECLNYIIEVETSYHQQLVDEDIRSCRRDGARIDKGCVMRRLLSRPRE